MPDQNINIPTTQQLVDQNIAQFESKLNQNVPATEKSFLRVLSVVQALNSTTNYKLSVYAILEAFALTASRAGLIRIGEDVDITPSPAIAAVLELEAVAQVGSALPSDVDYFSKDNGIRYRVDAPAQEDNEKVVFTVTAARLGPEGNLSLGRVLNISSPQPGIGAIATVVSLVETGANEEATEDFRIRVLDEIRAQGGGGNNADYRRWAQEVSGVARAFPYAGRPFNDNPEDSEPPERTVYVQSTVDVNADGIPPAGLLDQVRDSITTDPETGRARQPLGLTNETLFVEPIERIDIFIRVVYLNLTQAAVSNVEDEVNASLSTLFSILRPFVPGLDTDLDRRDTITGPTISSVVNRIIEINGGSTLVVSVGFGPGDLFEAYKLQPGELPKLLTVEFLDGSA